MGKRKLIAFGFLLLFLACSIRKTTQVTLKNKNNYPIKITLRTLNVEQRFGSIAAGETLKAQFDWTELEKGDGSWIVIVESPTGRDSFAHGYFTHGELTNYLEAEAEGDQLKIRLSN